MAVVKSSSLNPVNTCVITQHTCKRTFFFVSLYVFFLHWVQQEVGELFNWE